MLHGVPELMLRLTGTVRVLEFASVARRLKVKDPFSCAVPASCPSVATAKPTGKKPDATDHLYGDVPPTA